LHGAAGTVGEIGHIAVDPKATDLCNCGKRGCLEAVASLPNLVRQYRENLVVENRDARDVSATAFFEAARRDVPAAVAVVDRAARHLGIALAHLVQILNPELIVFGGYIIAQQDIFLPRIRTSLGDSLLPKLAERLDIKVSSLGLDIGLKGAASMAFRRCIDDPELLLTRVCSPAASRPAQPEAKPKRRAKK
jgi:glucokinase